jgi:hypothetical protein
MKFSKLIKFSILIVCVVNFMSISSKKAENKSNYDPILGPLIVKSYFSKVVDPARDNDKIYPDCINLLADDGRVEQQRRILWAQITAVLEKPKGIFKIKYGNELLDSQIGVSANGKHVGCGNYIKGMLMNDIKNEKTQKEIREELNKIIGNYDASVSKKANRLITHFVSDRRQKYLSADFFKKLNSKEGRR